MQRSGGPNEDGRRLAELRSEIEGLRALIRAEAEPSELEEVFRLLDRKIAQYVELSLRSRGSE